MSVIGFANVSKHFGKTQAVNDITLEVEKGQVVGFVGPNGAGKTTTIAMLMGFLQPSQGSVSLLGSPVHPASAHKLHARVGYAAGDMALFYNLRGWQYLNFMAQATAAEPTAQASLIQELQPMLHKPIKQLSRGNKQKIALIGALQHEPEMIILDEPTSGLDPLMQEVFLRLVAQAKERGATVFMSSHILSEVAYSCDRVLFMKDGSIIVDKPVEELRKQQGKMVSIRADKKVIQTITAKPLADTHNIQAHESNLQFRYTGATGPLLTWLAKLKISDVEIHHQDLDDIFHSLYQNEEGK